MGTWNTPVSTIINRLRDIIIFSDTGNNIENLALDLLNRAQNWLSMYRQWDYLKKVTELTVGANHIAILPSDVNSIISIYSDIEGVGKPSIYYHLNANDIAERYELYDTFSVVTGHSWYVQFPSAVPILEPLFIAYTYNLADIAPTDSFTFYPSELLLRCAQKLHIEDKGLTGDSIDVALRAFHEQLDNFVRNSQHVNHKMDLSVKDKWGNPIKLQGYRHDGAAANGQFSSYKPSSILTGQ
jgi:hypothetical protein